MYGPTIQIISAMLILGGVLLMCYRQQDPGVVLTILGAAGFSIGSVMVANMRRNGKRNGKEPD